MKSTPIVIVTLWLCVCGVFNHVNADEEEAPKHANPALTQQEWLAMKAAMPNGDAQRGQSLYQQSCAFCHGQQGRATTPQIPNLAGQRTLYLYKMLQDYKAQRLLSVVMSGMAAGLSDQDMADLTLWLSELPKPKATACANPPAILKGDHQRLLPPCESCHGANGQGWELQPALNGQSRDYLTQALMQFRLADKADQSPSKLSPRANDINAGMRQFAQKLTEQEIKDVVGCLGK